jgi:hypothetical protein
MIVGPPGVPSRREVTSRSSLADRRILMGIKDDMEKRIEGLKEGKSGPDSITLAQERAAEGLNPVEMDPEEDRELNLSMETD